MKKVLREEETVKYIRICMDLGNKSYMLMHSDKPDPLSCSYGNNYGTAMTMVEAGNAIMELLKETGRLYELTKSFDTDIEKLKEVLNNDH